VLPVRPPLVPPPDVAPAWPPPLVPPVLLLPAWPPLADEPPTPEPPLPLPPPELVLALWPACPPDEVTDPPEPAGAGVALQAAKSNNAPTIMDFGENTSYRYVMASSELRRVTERLASIRPNLRQDSFSVLEIQ
jgi:hypothetical protein